MENDFAGQVPILNTNFEMLSDWKRMAGWKTHEGCDISKIASKLYCKGDLHLQLF